MKKIILFIFLLGSTLAFSQIQEGVKAPPTDQSSRDQYVPGADIAPVFPGGITEFRNTVAKKINASKIKGVKGKLTSSAKFAVSAKGEIEQVSVTGDNSVLNHEVEKAIKSTKTKWTPATYKDNPVKYWFTIPFSIVFE